MKKIILLLALIIISGFIQLFPQSNAVIQAYLITCSPGTETYSIYGHSALRIVDQANKKDVVYNWGVFDFSTPHFVWKFAKGRLDYMLDSSSLQSFLQEYFIEKRSVYQQKINLEPGELARLTAMVQENLRPENRKYKYDFFYDDCSTRIRDLLEKSVGNKLLYASATNKNLLSFRVKVGEYQRSYPWLNFGVDLLMGTPGDKKASYRDRMFLPLEMQSELSEAVVNRDSKMIPLLQNPQMLLEFEPPEMHHSIFSTPIFLFSLLLILLIIVLSIKRDRKINKTVDIILFSVFSVLSAMMIFFNFFTDHQEMRKNLNIIWLNPFVFVCLASIIMNREWYKWFRLVFFLCLISFIIQLLFPNGFNDAFIPLMLILMLRSSARSGFDWNPFSVESF